VPIAQLAACFWSHQQNHCRLHQCPSPDTIRPTTSISSTPSQPIRTYAPIRLFSLHLSIPCPSHSSLYDYANSARSTKLPIMQFSATPLGQNILPNSLLSNSLNLGASPKEREPFTQTQTHKNSRYNYRIILHSTFRKLSCKEYDAHIAPTKDRRQDYSEPNSTSQHSLRLFPNEPPDTSCVLNQSMSQSACLNSQYSDFDTG